jgi:hypothetical protein
MRDVSEAPYDTGVILHNASNVRVSDGIIEGGCIGFGTAYGGINQVFDNIIVDKPYSQFCNMDTGLTNQNLTIQNCTFTANTNQVGPGLSFRSHAGNLTNLVIQNNTFNGTVSYLYGHINLTNTTTGGFQDVIIKGNRIGPVINSSMSVNITRATNVWIVNNIFDPTNSLIQSSANVFGGANYTSDGTERSIVVSDYTVNDITVRGTLNATNAVFNGGTLTNLSYLSSTNVKVLGVGDALLVAYDGLLTLEDSSSEFAELFDDNNGSGPLVQSFGPSITNASLTTPTINQPTFGVFWDDIATSGAILRGTGTGDPAWTEVEPGSGIYGVGFDAGESVNHAVQFKHGLASTNAAFPALYIEPHAHVSLSAAVAPAVSNHVWQLDYQWAKIGGDYLTTTNSIVVTNSFASTNAGMHSLVSFGYITNNLFQGTLSSIFRFRLSRVTYSTDAVPDGTEIIVDSFDIHAPMDRLGSDNPTSD